MIFLGTAKRHLFKVVNIMAEKAEKNFIHRIQHFFSNKKNVSILILLLGSGVLVGMALNIALGFSFYNGQGILGAIIAIFVVYLMS